MAPRQAENSRCFLTRLEAFLHRLGLGRNLLRERTQFLALALAVVGALAAPAVTTNGAHAHDAEQPDRWLKDEEAAALLSVSTRWLRRHGPNLPFRRSLSGKIIRYSEAGLRRWQARQRP